MNICRSSSSDYLKVVLNWMFAGHPQVITWKSPSSEYLHALPWIFAGRPRVITWKSHSSKYFQVALICLLKASQTLLKQHLQVTLKLLLKSRPPVNIWHTEKYIYEPVYWQYGCRKVPARSSCQPLSNTNPQLACGSSRVHTMFVRAVTVCWP